jgi:hypothetical protein
MTARSLKSAHRTGQTARYADMFSALGTESRLQILRLLLKAHPEGLVVGDIQSELGIPASTLSHHLERLRPRGWRPFGGKERFSAIRRTRPYSRNCSGSCSRSAVHEATQSTRTRWPASAAPYERGARNDGQPEAGRRRAERPGHQRPGRGQFRRVLLALLLQHGPGGDHDSRHGEPGDGPMQFLIDCAGPSNRVPTITLTVTTKGCILR